MRSPRHLDPIARADIDAEVRRAVRHAIHERKYLVSPAPIERLRSFALDSPVLYSRVRGEAPMQAFIGALLVRILDATSAVAATGVSPGWA